MTTCDHEQAEHEATLRLTRATWALVLATAVLVVVTALLAAVTYEEKHRSDAPAVAATEVVHSR
jgi:hypothetical protein